MVIALVKEFFNFGEWFDPGMLDVLVLPDVASGLTLLGEAVGDFDGLIGKVMVSSSL